MARIFIVDEREHPDPDPNLSIEQVRDMFADFYPDLANATHTITPRGEDQVVDFRRTVGTKGQTRAAYYAKRGWDGICVACGHDYINNCHGDCTCLSCNAQRQDEVKDGLTFTDVDLPPIERTTP